MYVYISHLIKPLSHRATQVRKDKRLFLEAQKRQQNNISITKNL